MAMDKSKKTDPKKKKSPNEFAQKNKDNHSAFALAEKLKERKKMNKTMLDSI